MKLRREFIKMERKRENEIRIMVFLKIMVFMLFTIVLIKPIRIVKLEILG